MGRFNGDAFDDLTVESAAQDVAVLLTRRDLADLGVTVADAPDPIVPDPVTFFVRRTGASAITVPLVAVDTCGEWLTFVGGEDSAS